MVVFKIHIGVYIGSKRSIKHNRSYTFMRFVATELAMIPY